MIMNSTKLLTESQVRNFRIKRDKVLKSGQSKFCGIQPLINLKGYDLLKQTIFLLVF